MALPSRVILASASPRRSELLEQIGIESIVVPPDLDEASIRRSSPSDLAMTLAREKARTVAARISSGDHALAAGIDPADGPIPIVAADTVVAAVGRIMEKPDDRNDAREMLRMLSGRTHQVITGIAITADGSRDDIVCRYCETHVTFADLDDETVEWYLDSDEWQGVAGAYRIQGHAARFITHVSGSYSNVVGLPLHLVSAILSS